MIIRIMAEGQYDVADESVAALNALDAELEAAVQSGDDTAFSAALGQLLERVRAHGTALAPEVLVDSDLVLPPADATIEEVAELLGDEGLIPG